MKNSRFEIEKEGIISCDEIKLILDRYRIGKKPLAKLLGWGETTIIRYMEGDIPTSEYSNKLLTILEDPEYYYDLLLKRKECLTTVAFKKSKKAALSKIMASKIYAVAYYIVNKTDGETCASYVQFHLYYTQAFSLALYDKEAFQEDCCLNSEYTPYTKIYESMKHCGVHTLEFGEDYLSDGEKELIDAVLDAFSWYGLKALQSMMNSEKAYLKISRDKFGNRIAAKDALKSYFKEILEKYHITEVKDIRKYPEQMMPEILDLCKSS
ncbi:MAG: hypothetical protein K0S76_1368 [Herbinix sp.]|jgi:hypothetical protein|nr:hypothetical protein [Herbinix sp.]